MAEGNLRNCRLRHVLLDRTGMDLTERELFSESASRQGFPSLGARKTYRLLHANIDNLM